MQPIVRQPQLATISYAALRQTAEQQLTEVLEAGTAGSCRDFSQLAYDYVQGVAYSVQFVYDPKSHTGVSLSIQFWPEYKLEPIAIVVPAAWIAWQITPR